MYHENGPFKGHLFLQSFRSLTESRPSFNFTLCKTQNSKWIFVISRPYGARISQFSKTHVESIPEHHYYSKPIPASSPSHRSHSSEASDSPECSLPNNVTTLELPKQSPNEEKDIKSSPISQTDSGMQTGENTPWKSMDTLNI